jgi:hypothetical protein
VILWCGLLIGALLLVSLLPALDTNDNRNQEEEEFGDHPEEDQGQAKKGKPSICCISESYQVTMHCSTLALTTMHCFSYIAIYP